MDRLAAYSGGERRNTSISKSSLEDLSKGSDQGGCQGLHGEHGCFAGGNLESTLKLQDPWRMRRDVFLGRLVDDMLP